MRQTFCDIKGRIMTAVGIDVSKGKSMVAAMYGVGEVTAAQNKFLRIYYARGKEALEKVER